MSEQYAHLLIARDAAFVPTTTQVRACPARLAELGVLPLTPDMVLRTPTGAFRDLINPISGEVVRIPQTEIHSLADLDAFESATNQLFDYEFEASSFWRPRLGPLPIDTAGPYFLGVIFSVSSVLRSTSHYVPEGDPLLKVDRFGTPCQRAPEIGVFTNPHNHSTIEVPEAGAAHFWIQIELGKFLFPALPHGSLDILAPEVVNAAEQVFDIRFAQGCYWG